MIDTLNSPYIHAADSGNFKALVLDNSYKGPVLVNFWSRKAGPCLRQYPILDQLIHHYAGRLLLINVDTEREFVYTKEYAVTSVPLIKLFRQGQVVETWRGYQSETDLRKVLDMYVARDSDRHLSQAIRLYADGQTTEAYAMLATAIINDPENPRLPLAVSKLLKHERRYEEALRLIDSLPELFRAHRDIAQIRDILLFAVEVEPELDAAGLQALIQASPDAMAPRRQLVAYLVLQQQYEAALGQLTEMMALDKNYDNNYPQQAMLRIFRILGEGHALIGEYRQTLTRYSH